ncbi:hypothetical protein B296_00024149 [Ensete ventricosum]|uniref:Uncharacterized protein n=1 Tax=Ensete ventricosum TaxID=4639 RepID=A0A426YYQ0_ENSVE|nr:hypothetical protein B296_00024149 [Ensete ventricosum]
MAYLKRELTPTRPGEDGRLDLEGVALRKKDESWPSFGVVGDSIAYCSEGTHVENGGGVGGIQTVAAIDRLWKRRRRRRMCNSGVCRVQPRVPADGRLRCKRRKTTDGIWRAMLYLGRLL